MQFPYTTGVIPDSHYNDVDADALRTEMWNNAIDLRSDEFVIEQLSRDVVMFPLRAPSPAMLRTLASWLLVNQDVRTFSLYDKTTCWILHAGGEEKIEWWNWEGPLMGIDGRDLDALYDIWSGYGAYGPRFLWWDGTELHQLPFKN